MNAEEYYRKKDYPILDKFDKKAPKFDYYDFIDFAESYHKAKLNLLTLTDVVGQSEQYHCELYDFGRKDKPCDKQCDGCKAMNLD